MAAQVDHSNQVQQVQDLIVTLDAAKGDTGCSMISLILPPQQQLAEVNKRLADEHKAASRIKSATNRRSILSAIATAQQVLQLYNKTPNNGLFVYCGTGLDGDGGEKSPFNLHFEPFKPTSTYLYLYDNKFHTEPLAQLLEAEPSAQQFLVDRKLDQERQLVNQFLREMSLDSGKFCCGIKDTFKALDLGAVQTLIIWDQLNVQRYVFANPTPGGKEIVKFLTPNAQAQGHLVQDGEDLQVLSKVSLLAWLSEHSREFGATLRLVTSQTQEGARFADKIGGVGGLLRYKADL